MQFKQVFFSQSFKDFKNLFLSNIFQKILGLIRELIIAFFLGSSVAYANFLLLRVVADFFSQMTAGNALKANLLPRFTKFYTNNNLVSLKQVFRFSDSTTIFIFLLSQVIQTSVILYLGLQDNLLFFAASFILSLSICFNFINTIFLTIIQARGRFLKYSLASVQNSFMFTLVLYPLISVFSFVGLAASRLIGVLSMNMVFVRPMRKEDSGEELKLTYKDFDFSTLILGNFANIIIISSRFISGSDGSNGITFFMYAVVILNTLLTAVVGNISTILLRKISINKNNSIMYISLIVSVIIGVLMIGFLYFFSYDIVELMYLRGAFNLNDVKETASYLYSLSFGFVLLFIATILFQPFLSLSINKTKNIRKKIVLIFLSSILIFSCLALFSQFGVMGKTLFVMYASSITVVILATYSYIRYLKHEV